MTPPAPSAPKFDLNKVITDIIMACKREVDTFTTAFRDKGTNRFGRILIIGISAVYISSALVYSPLAKQRAGLDRKISAAKAVAQYSDRYKNLRQELSEVYAAMPVAQGDSWLLDRVRQTLDERGLVSQDFSPPEILPSNGFSTQIVRFSMDARFQPLVAWLNTIELSQGSLQIVSLQISKGTTDIGLNRVTLAVGAITPARRQLP